MPLDVTHHPVLDRRLLLGGAALVGAGAALWFIGAVLTAVATADAVRRWVHGWEVPPQELARRGFQQVRSTAAAGAQAVRHRSSSTAP
jgi:hypothetical protein